MRLVRQQLRSDTGWLYRRTQVYIYLSDGSTLASIFNGDSSPHPNPLITREDGYVEFYVADNVLSLTYRAVVGFDQAPVRPLMVGVVVTQTKSDALTTSGIAAETIFIGNAVGFNSSGLVKIIDATNIGDADSCVGVAAQSALPGQTLQIFNQGMYDKASFNFLPGLPIFVGPAGTLTQTVPIKPVFAFSQMVGVAVSTTKIDISIEPAIDLA